MKNCQTTKREPYYCETRHSWVIPLTQGRETLVDQDIASELGKTNWHLLKNKANNGYAKDSKGNLIHRVIMEAPFGMEVDHINGNSLDNRRSNLRVCTSRENQQNRHYHRSGRLVGATFHKLSGKWQCVMNIDGKPKHIGLYKTEFEAHEAYKDELKKIAGN